MNWHSLWQSWQFWLVAIGATMATLWTVPTGIAAMFRAYDELIWRFFGADILEQIKTHAKYGGSTSAGTITWYQPVSVSVLAKEVNRSEFVVKRSLNHLRRKKDVKRHGEDWIATGGAN